MMPTVFATVPPPRRSRPGRCVRIVRGWGAAGARPPAWGPDRSTTGAEAGSVRQRRRAGRVPAVLVTPKLGITQLVFPLKSVRTRFQIMGKIPGHRNHFFRERRIALLPSQLLV